MAVGGVEHRFGPYGGQYVPETLMPALAELEAAWLAAQRDPSYAEELAELSRDFCGRPTPLYLAERLSEIAGREVWLKREDLMHTGSHKLNNALGQGLLARRMGKTRIIAETGAGSHGVATATAAANARSFSGSLTPGRASVPLAVSTANGRVAATAAPTLPGVRPPLSTSGTAERRLRTRSQSNVSPVPP